MGLPRQITIRLTAAVHRKVVAKVVSKRPNRQGAISFDPDSPAPSTSGACAGGTCYFSYNASTFTSGPSRSAPTTRIP
jgi:hypothetical protein